MKTFTFSTDKNLCITSWGKKISDITGRSPVEVRGKKYHDVLPRIFNGRTDAVLHVLRTKKRLKYSGYSFRCFSGQILAEVMITPVIGSNGNDGGAKISVFPHSLCPVAVNYQNSQRLINIGKVASTFAHGVRNHLNVIKGVVAWLNEKYAGDAALLDFTAITEEEIAQLDNFISKFLSTSLASINASEIDINQILRKLEVFCSMQTKVKKIKCSYELGDIPMIFADQFQIEQALLNVINNAIEAMEPGGCLSVRSGCESIKNRKVVVIEVSDTGKGMPHDKLKDLSTSHFICKNGKGFGLFLTREIMHCYGGQMEITSKKGTGTTVRLVFIVKPRQHD